MSQPYLKPPDPRPRGRRSPTGGFTRWRLVPAQPDERTRWESLDGRWVSIGVGHGASAGKAVVADSHGRYEAVDSYEDALVLAKSWRS